MLNRYWRWTSAPGVASPAPTGVPFGPLRYRAWTSASGTIPAPTGLPFGPLRYRAWTNGTDTPPAPPLFMPFYRIPVPRPLRRPLIDDEELMLFIAAWVTETLQ